MQGQVCSECSDGTKQTRDPCRTCGFLRLWMSLIIERGGNKIPPGWDFLWLCKGKDVSNVSLGKKQWDSSVSQGLSACVLPSWTAPLCGKCRADSQSWWIILKNGPKALWFGFSMHDVYALLEGIA